ncbi:MAG: hypothetical protein NXH85_15895 [Pseudomonadaceae bacterium]|nr:hypothetical protein [Pseudomonadaceae bacterium]
MLSVIVLASLAAFECGDLDSAVLGEAPDPEHSESAVVLPDIEVTKPNGELCATVSISSEDGRSRQIVKDANGRATYFEIQSSVSDRELITRYFDGNGALIFTRIATMQGTGGVLDSMEYFLPDGTEVAYCDLEDALSPIQSRAKFDRKCSQKQTKRE